MGAAQGYPRTTSPITRKVVAPCVLRAALERGREMTDDDVQSFLGTVDAMVSTLSSLSPVSRANARRWIMIASHLQALALMIEKKVVPYFAEDIRADAEWSDT